MSDLRTSPRITSFAGRSPRKPPAKSVDVGQQSSAAPDTVWTILNRCREKRLPNTLNDYPSQQSCRHQKQTSQEWNFYLHQIYRLSFFLQVMMATIMPDRIDVDGNL